MRKKKQPDVINQISMSIEDFHRLCEKINNAYDNAGFEDIRPDRDFENDMIAICSINGNISVEINIRLSTREIIQII